MRKSISEWSVLSGALGIVVVPDQETVQRSYVLAAEILPRGSEYVLAPGSLPHLTLYHGKLRDVPMREALQMVSELRGILVGQRFSLGPIVAYGGNFVFWNVAQDSDTKLLKEAHSRALSVAQFLDRTLESKATSEEGLVLSQPELENVRQYGHPLVRQLYAPHITLGFHRGIARSLAPGLHNRAEFSVASVDMARIGFPGQVESLVDLEKAV